MTNKNRTFKVGLFALLIALSSLICGAAYWFNVKTDEAQFEKDDRDQFKTECLASFAQAASESIFAQTKVHEPSQEEIDVCIDGKIKEREETIEHGKKFGLIILGSSLVGVFLGGAATGMGYYQSKNNSPVQTNDLA